MATLFDIGEELLALNALLEDAEVELNPEALAAVDEWFRSIAGCEAEKLEGYVALIKQLDMEGAAATAEAEQWQMRARTRANRVKYLKQRMLEHLQETQRKEVKTSRGHKIAIQNNGGKYPLDISGQVTYEDVPVEFVKVAYSIDTDKVREAVETVGIQEGPDGKPVMPELKLPDGTPWASLQPRGVHLRIR